MIKVILVGIALSFVIGFGILPTLRDPGGEENVVARVGDRSITRGEWNRAYENMIEFYRDLYKDRFSDEMIQRMRVRESALDNLINQALQQQEAVRLNLQVSDRELQERIRSLPYFQRDGRFSKELYLTLLSRNRMTPSDFESLQREEMLVGKLRDMVQGSVKVSDRELRNRYALDNEEVVLEGLVLDPQQFEGQATVDDEALKAYFAENREQFLSPEKVKIEYVRVSPDPYMDQVKVYTGDVEEYYDTHIDEFSHPEDVWIRNILIRVPPGADPSAVETRREELERIKERIDGGEDFAEMAKQHSEDGSASAGGDLGYRTRERLEPELAEAAFSLKPGEVSDIVRAQSGFHLVKMEELREARVDPLQEVAEQIRKKLQEEEAWRLARRRAEDVLWSSRESGAFSGLAGDQGPGLAVEETGFFARGESAPPLGQEPAVQAAAFETDPGSFHNAVRGKNGYYVLRTVKRMAPDVPPFKVVRDRVEEAYRRQQGRVLAQERGRQLLEAVREGASMEALAGQDEAVAFIEPAPFSRMSPYIPRIGASPELVASAFSLSDERPVAAEVFDVNGKYYVIRFKERTEPDWTTYAQEREAYRQRQLDRKKQDVFRQWLSDLREKGDVKAGPVS